jgi:hypothetical protein
MPLYVTLLVIRTSLLWNCALAFFESYFRAAPVPRIEGHVLAIYILILWLPPASSCLGWVVVSYAEYLPNRAYVSFWHCYLLVLVIKYHNLTQSAVLQ